MQKYSIIIGWDFMLPSSFGNWPYPAPLFPVGTMPMLLILLEELIMIRGMIAHIYLLTFRSWKIQLEKELKRWNEYTTHPPITLFYFDSPSPNDILTSFFLEPSIHLLPEDPCLFIPGNMPLLSHKVISRVLTSPLPCPLLLVGHISVEETRDNPVYVLSISNLKISPVPSISPSSLPSSNIWHLHDFTEEPPQHFQYAKFLGILRFQRQHFVSTFSSDVWSFDIIWKWIQQYSDISILKLTKEETRQQAVLIENFLSFKIAEQFFTERKHSAFLHRCYYLWKQFHRIQQHLNLS